MEKILKHTKPPELLLFFKQLIKQNTQILYISRKLTLNGFALPTDSFLTSLSFGFMLSTGPEKKKTKKYKITITKPIPPGLILLIYSTCREEH